MNEEQIQPDDGGMSRETAIAVVKKQGLRLANMGVQLDILEIEREQMLARIEELEQARQNNGVKAKAE